VLEIDVGLLAHTRKRARGPPKKNLKVNITKYIQNTFRCWIYFIDEQTFRQLSPLSRLLPASKF